MNYDRPEHIHLDVGRDFTPTGAEEVTAGADDVPEIGLREVLEARLDDDGRLEEAQEKAAGLQLEGPIESGDVLALADLVEKIGGAVEDREAGDERFLRMVEQEFSKQAGLRDALGKVFRRGKKPSLLQRIRGVDPDAAALLKAREAEIAALQHQSAVEFEKVKLEQVKAFKAEAMGLNAPAVTAIPVAKPSALSQHAVGLGVLGGGGAAVAAQRRGGNQ